MSGVISPFGAGLQSQATAGASGFALQNATPSIATWTTPNDGKVHRVILIASLDVTSVATGGTISITYTMPDGNTHTSTVFATSQTAGGHISVTGVSVEANTTVSVTQSAALTAGAATLWAELWGN